MRHPPQRCQIDHIVPYSKGGETTQENGRVYCSFHNRLRNHEPPGCGGEGDFDGDLDDADDGDEVGDDDDFELDDDYGEDGDGGGP